MTATATAVATVTSEQKADLPDQLPEWLPAEKARIRSVGRMLQGPEREQATVRVFRDFYRRVGWNLYADAMELLLWH